jgi:hypothetical protein
MQEQVGGRGEVSRINQPLLFLGQVSAEAADTGRLQPHPPVSDLNLAEHWRLRKLIPLTCEVSVSVSSGPRAQM